MAQKKESPRYYTKALRCPDGSRKYIRGKTKEELEKKVMLAQAELGLGININDGTTVAQFAQMWVDVYKKPTVAPQTLDLIKGQLNGHILPVLGGRRVRDVRPADCALVMSRMAQNGLAKGRADDVRSRLKEMFECAVENSLLVRNPVQRSVTASGRAKRKRVPLTEAQLDALCAATAARPKLADVHTFVLIARYTGMRAAEIVGLHSSSIDLNSAQLVVKEQYFSRKGKAGTTEILKSDSAHRVIPLPLPLLAHLSTVLPKAGGGYLFNVAQPGLCKWIGDRLRALCRYDCEGNPRNHNPRLAVLDFYVHPHLIRHSYATKCVQAGVDVKTVQYLLGHSTVEMTLDIYSHYEAESRVTETASQLNEVFPAPVLSAVGG